MAGVALDARTLHRGWAEADPVKIASATAPAYRFDDPFVGTFASLALPRYFQALTVRVGLGAFVARKHLSFVLRGPMDTLSSKDEQPFWREATLLGITGTSLITVSPGGVMSERVACDLNLASEQLRRPDARIDDDGVRARKRSILRGRYDEP